LGGKGEVMAAKKKRQRTKPRSRTVALARREPPPVYAPGEGPNDGEAVYVRVPLAPHVVTAFREHAANGARLVELLTGTESAAAEIFEQIARTASALERDVAKVRARLKQRRR
jgi:hypothetical protein